MCSDNKVVVRDFGGRSLEFRQHIQQSSRYPDLFRKTTSLSVAGTSVSLTQPESSEVKGRVPITGE